MNVGELVNGIHARPYDIGELYSRLRYMQLNMNAYSYRDDK